METTRLSDIGKGSSARIVAIEGKDDIRRRLMELGMVEGTQVRCILMSGGGSMRAYSVRGSVIGLRRRDAAGIIVDEVKCNGRM